MAETKYLKGCKYERRFGSFLSFWIPNAGEQELNFDDILMVFIIIVKSYLLPSPILIFLLQRIEMVKKKNYLLVYKNSIHFGFTEGNICLPQVASALHSLV